MKLYFSGFTVFCVFAYVADSDLEALLRQIYFVASFPAGKEHLNSKSSLVTLQTWVNTAKQVLRDTYYTKKHEFTSVVFMTFHIYFQKTCEYFFSQNACGKQEVS